MLPRHDMACSNCGEVWPNSLLAVEGKRCLDCGKGRMEILWSTHYQRDALVHTSERTALMYSAKEKKWQYPSSNNTAIPDRLRKRGYERVELPSLRAVEQHEKKAGVQSERAWFDKGSARGFDE